MLSGLRVRGRDLVLAHPVIEALVAKGMAGLCQGDEEPIGLKVVGEVKAVRLGVVAAPDAGAGVLGAERRQEPRPPRREQEDGRMPLPALGSETQPVEDQATVFEPGGAELRGARAGKEELLELGLVEVAVLRERGENCNVPWSQLAE